MIDTPDQLWWSAAEIADAKMPDLPSTRAKVHDRAKREGWAKEPGKARRRKGVGGGLEYHWTVLPMRARMALLQIADAPEPVRSRDEAWAEFEKLSKAQKAKAETRLIAVSNVEAIEAAGFTRSDAVNTAAQQAGTSPKTVWNWLALVDAVAHEDRLAYLAPRLGQTKRASAELSPEFVALVKSDWLRQSQPSLTSCYDRAERIAKAEGIAVSPLHQVRRHLKATISKPTEILMRKGPQALKAYYPHQDRDKSAMAPMECVCADYHKFDVFIRWPGETLPVRAQMIAFTDIYSGKFLAWRLSLTANSHTVQLTFGDLVERYGIPKAALLDNGREFAAKVFTGGAPTRFRFKVKEDDIPGLLPMLGVKVHWATPYSGQSKPIERAFRDLCDRVAKHPAFEGAYTGNKPDAKPENYGNRAIPLDEFRTVLDEEMEAHNARQGRRSEVAFGRSFNEVFEEGYKATPIRKATAEQRRLWLMGAEGVRGKNTNGELTLLGSRYWSEWMYRIAGKKVVARFDPDNLHAGVHVYDLDGHYLGHAGTVAKGGFLNVEDGRDLARKKRRLVKAAKDAAQAEKELSAAEIAARLKAAGEDVAPDDLPEADVVQLVPTHKAAPKASKPNTPASVAAPVSRLADRWAASQSAKSDGTPEDRYNRACELEAILDEGEALTAAQAAWLSDYQESAEYAAQKKLSQAFGSSS